MEWEKARIVISNDAVFEGVLYRGAESTGTMVRSSPTELEVGPVRWDLPKRIKFIRMEQQWYQQYDEDPGYWKPWEDAAPSGLGAFMLLDPRCYANLTDGYQKTESHAFLDIISLRVRFDATRLVEPMMLPKELMNWCQDLLGEFHEVSFLWRQNKLVAIVERDVWLTDDLLTIVFDAEILFHGSLLGLASQPPH